MTAAEIAFQGALAADSVNAAAHRGLGRVYLKLGRFQPAVDAFQLSLRADATSAETFDDLGHALNRQGKPEEAVQAFKSALAIEPLFAGAHNNMGNALFELNRANEALACYEKALASRPDFADALVNMAQVLGSLKRPKEAATAFDRALAIDSHAKWLFGSWLHTRMRVCNWLGINEAFSELARREVTHLLVEPGPTLARSMIGEFAGTTITCVSCVMRAIGVT